MSTKKSRLVWFNGELIPESEAKISIYDSALMFGDMVFEMTRSFKKTQFKLRDHLERLYASARYVRIPIDMGMDEMERHIYATIEANEPLFSDDDEHRLMIDVSRGLLSIYQEIVGVHKGTNVIIADFPLRWTVAGMGKLFDAGINAVITSQRAIPARLLEPKVKNRSRLHYLMANIEAANHEGDNNWALLLDPDGFIAEGTGDNFFIVKDNAIITPEPRNILRGVSRAYIFELAQKLSLACIEKNIEPYDVMAADEAFMTGTPFCLLPVSSLNHVAIGDRAMGKITQQLLDTWSSEVDLDIVGQIKQWDAERGLQSSMGPSPYSFKNK
ncbi:MAG: aminotransferase class IV [Bacteroidales bacterium]|nr:aminotransferase class IV [Bacteroidales bacterium]